MTAAAVRDVPAPRDVPARQPMTGADLLRWRTRRRYTGYLQVVADLGMPLPSLAKVAAGKEAVPPDVERLCEMVELLDGVAAVDPDALPFAADRALVVEARALLAAWRPDRPRSRRRPPRVPGQPLRRDRRSWQRRRVDRLCQLAGLVSRVAAGCRSAALADASLRAAEMVAGWAGTHA